MSSTPETHDDHVAENNTTSEGNSFGSSIVLFVVIFALFIGGLYVMSLYTISHWLFAAGMLLSIVALFVAFDLVPRFLSR